MATNKVVETFKGIMDPTTIGFILTMVAAIFYHWNQNEAATAFFGAGAALLGVQRQASPQQQQPTTIHADNIETTNVVEPKA